MIRFGIAGFGLHAVRRLMPGFALAQNCKVIALSRRDAQKASESARQYGIQHVFTSTAELCRCPEVDAVLVTTPNACHLQDKVVSAQSAGRTSRMRPETSLQKGYKMKPAVMPIPTL